MSYTLESLCTILWGSIRMLENIKKLQVKSVFLLFLSGFGFYLCIFSRNHLVPMVDGPYYLIQIKSILTTGSLVYGAPPLTFYLLSIFSFLSGDVTSGLKVGGFIFLCPVHHSCLFSHSSPIFGYLYCFSFDLRCR